MKSVAVFCGSNVGNKPVYESLARDLGTAIGQMNLRLVYGGGNVGLMGTIADACLDAGGEVLGVIPEQLMQKELGHRGVSELRITTSMHERKAAMERESDGFIALPGGFGTLDEFCEIITWAQLGIHRKPCAVLDSADGYFRHLLAFFDTAVESGFVSAEHNRMILRDDDPESLLRSMQAWKPTVAEKWIDREALAD